MATLIPAEEDSLAVSDILVPEAKEHADRIGGADLVLALPSCQTGESLDAAVGVLRPALPAFLPNQRVVILHPDTATNSTEGNAEQVGGEASVHLFPYPMSPVGRYQEQSLYQDLRSLLQVGKTLGARTYVMMGSETSADGLRGLAEPVLNQGYDLAVPLYSHRKFDSLINSGIVYPLTRAMYGARLHYPMATDLALSARLAEQFLQPSSASGQNPSSWITIKAVCAGLQVCEVRRDFAPAPSVSEPTDLSASLAEVLSTLFAGLERDAVFWQKVRGSRTVRAFGQPSALPAETASADVHEMIETFQRGCKDLLEIWAIALSPVTLLDLKRLAKLPQNKFQLADSVWVHVIYDFILRHRQRVISREHLLRSMTPIYLAWVASYALEVQNASPGAVENRMERLCIAFEDLKPYLLSQWRWPDRFNP
jgi:glucosylglycerate synthase